MGSSLCVCSPCSPFVPRKKTSKDSSHRIEDVNHENTLVHVLPKTTTQVTNVIPEDPPAKPKNSDVSLPEGGSSEDTTIFCKICMESMPVYNCFTTQTCSHLFCSECISHHIASKVEENRPVVRCPEANCKAMLVPKLCRSIIPLQVFERWCKILCEESIDVLDRLYCPYKDCSALLLLDKAQRAITQANCPHCCRLFCAKCKVAPWHKGIKCAEYQKLGLDERGKEDIQLKILAKKMRWVRCPKCGYYVERAGGCKIMECRCKHKFCYKCGGDLGLLCESHLC